MVPPPPTVRQRIRPKVKASPIEKRKQGVEGKDGGAKLKKEKEKEKTKKKPKEDKLVKVTGEAAVQAAVQADLPYTGNYSYI